MLSFLRYLRKASLSIRLPKKRKKNGPFKSLHLEGDQLEGDYLGLVTDGDDKEKTHNEVDVQLGDFR